MNLCREVVAPEDGRRPHLHFEGDAVPGEVLRLEVAPSKLCRLDQLEVETHEGFYLKGFELDGRPLFFAMEVDLPAVMFSREAIGNGMMAFVVSPGKVVALLVRTEGARRFVARAYGRFMSDEDLAKQKSGRERLLSGALGPEFMTGVLSRLKKDRE